MIMRGEETAKFISYLQTKGHHFQGEFSTINKKYDVYQKWLNKLSEKRIHLFWNEYIIELPKFSVQVNKKKELLKSKESILKKMILCL